MTGLNKSAIVGVIGAGAMGAGIAQVAAQAGHEVRMFDAAQGAAEKGRASIIAGLSRQMEKGRISADERDRIADRLTVAPSLDALADCGLVIEAIIERLDIKRQVFSALEAVVSPQAILATNTSSLSVTAIAAGLKHPHRVAGLHFFNPAPVMKLVEIVAGLASQQTILDTLYATARDWGKAPVHTKSTPGFIVNRVARPFYAEGLRLVEENAADPATIDAVMREAGGFRMGPFELMDLIGHDVNSAVTRSVFDSYFSDPRYRPSLIQQELVAAGWLGRKSGRGFYVYGEGVERPLPRTLPPATAPRSITIDGDTSWTPALLSMFEKAGLATARSGGQRGYIVVEGAHLALTDGRTATARVAAGEPTDLVLFDLALDFGSASRIALAKADQGAESAINAAAAVFQATGKSVSIVDDTPGLIVMRTLAMLANEAVDAIMQGVASCDDIDRAMQLGVNYPRGPLAWADAVGSAHILAVLEALHDAYGDDRYRPSQLLRRKVASGMSLSRTAGTKQ